MEGYHESNEGCLELKKTENHCFRMIEKQGWKGSHLVQDPIYINIYFKQVHTAKLMLVLYLHYYQKTLILRHKHRLEESCLYSGAQTP